jgi:hypothetical protein
VGLSRVTKFPLPLGGGAGGGAVTRYDFAILPEFTNLKFAKKYERIHKIHIKFVN